MNFLCNGGLAAIQLCGDMPVTAARPLKVSNASGAPRLLSMIMSAENHMNHQKLMLQNVRFPFGNPSDTVVLSAMKLHESSETPESGFASEIVLGSNIMASPASRPLDSAGLAASAQSV
jgi:hypothetical protein